ncbi:putative ATP-grasp-modified RiPP [Streptomyces sp. NPDC058440]|uniref:putative ATP-grasp-modified RiPP n=1 Tax=Streptomyces sp. NPDC058440 TaxID=3346501 RepID=UPI003653209B
MAAPFALLVESPRPPADRTPAFSYDRARQLNVTPTGEAVVEAAPAAMFGPTYTHNSSGHKKDDD